LHFIEHEPFVKMFQVKI